MKIFNTLAFLLCLSLSYAQTDGTLTFSFTPTTHYGYSGTKNVLAVWIQDASGNFVKTKLRYVGYNTSDHLPDWATNSGGPSYNALSSSCNTTDATTGATLTSFTTKTITWDAKNVNGSQNGSIVTDGTYKVTIQETWDHGTSGTTLRSFTFTKGPNPDVQTPSNDANFTNISLNWQPVAQAPTSSFTTQNNSTTYCVGSTIQLVNNSSNATSYSWSASGGTFSSTTAANPTVTFSSSGSHTVTLTATGAGGTNTSSQTINIVAQPVSQFTQSATNVTLPNSTVNFTNQSTGATSYSWNFGDGNTSTATNPSNTYTAAGTYNVTLSASNSSCPSNSSNVTIIVSNSTPTPPVASFTTQNNATQFCAGTAVSFTNNSTNATTFSWDFGDGNTSTTASPSNTFTSGGTYNVTLTASGSGGTNTTNQTITIVDQPVAQFLPSATNLTMPNSTVNFTNQSTNATTYNWDFGDANTSTTFSPSHTYSSSGTYNVVLTANSSSCPSNSSTRTITISGGSNPPPVASFSTQNTNNTFCTGDFVYLTNNSSNATSYSWNITGGAPSSSTVATPVVVYSTAGTYSIVLTATGPGGTNTTTHQVTVMDPPVADYSYSPSIDTVNVPISFTNNSTSANSYFWDFGDGNYSTQQNPTHTYTATGNYTVALTSGNNVCADNNITKSITVISDQPSSIDDNQKVEEFKLYPNPVNDQINLQFTLSEKSTIGIDLISISGQKVSTLVESVNFSPGTQQISTPIAESVSKGIYFLQIKIDDQTYQKKIVIK